MTKKEFLTVLALGPAVAVHAHAEIYMTEEKAAATIFPGAIFERKQYELKPEMVKKIEDASGETVRSPRLKFFRSKENNFVLVDQVLGKHEFITYAVGIDPEGKVRGLEILEYRESYGSQVKEAAWKSQFVGKTKLAPLKVNSDIHGISGATLSSTHVTAGVRRLIHTYDEIKAQL